MEKIANFLLILLYIFGFTEIFALKISLSETFAQYEQNMNEAIRSVRSIQHLELLNNITYEAKHFLDTVEIFPRDKMDNLKYYKESQKG